MREDRRRSYPTSIPDGSLFIQSFSPLRNQSILLRWRCRSLDNYRRMFLEFPAKAERCLTLPQTYSAANWDELQESGLGKRSKLLYFKSVAKSSSQKQNPIKPRLHLEPDGDCFSPCTTEEKSTLYLKNWGGGSKGLSIYFTGPYVKNDELTFSDTTLWRWKGNDLEAHPFELQKICMPDGKWVYYYMIRIMKSCQSLMRSTNASL